MQFPKSLPALVYARLIRLIPALVLAAAVFASPPAAQVTAPDAAQLPRQLAPQLSWRLTTEYPQNSISGIGLVTLGKLVSERTDAGRQRPGGYRGVGLPPAIVPLICLKPAGHFAAILVACQSLQPRLS